MALNPSEGWNWYRQLDISNATADYQIKLRLYENDSSKDDPSNGTIDLAGHCENFPNDIRFGTTNDPSTAEQLPQWIEYYESGGGGLEGISYNSSIFSIASQGVAMDDEYLYGINGKVITVTKISDGKSIKAGFQYDASEDSYTDYTDEMNSLSNNDVELLPSSPAVGDAFYFGLYNKFTTLSINIGTAGADITITWKYWNGKSWANLPSITDNTNSFTTSGENCVYWSRPSDWQQNTVNGVTAYWVKAEVTSVGSAPSQPKAYYAVSGRYCANDGTYTEHLSDGHVLQHGEKYFLYIAGDNYPNTPKSGAVYKYKLAGDPDEPLDYVGVVKNFTSENCPGYLSGVDKYEVDGTTYWWVTFDVDSTSSSNPSQVWRYDYNPSDDTDWANKTVYNLGYYHSGYNIQGFTWWEDNAGNKYIFCPIHEGSSPATIDVYKWNGNGFDNYAQYNYIQSPDGDKSSQGVCRDFSGGDYLYFASRQGLYGRPILKADIEQSSTTSYVDIWVKLPSNNPDTIYLFAGNSEASEYSNGSAVFDFFEDFEYSDALQNHGWVKDEPENGNIIPSINNNYEYSGTRCVKVDSSTLSNYHQIINKGASILEIRCFPTSTSARTYFAVAGNTDNSDRLTIAIYQNANWKYWDGTWHTSSKAINTNAWNKIKYVANGNGNIKLYVDDTLIYSGSRTDEINRINFEISSVYYTTYWDTIFVRKYTDPEPTWSSFGSWTSIGGGQAYETTLTDTISLSDSLSKLPAIIGTDTLSLADADSHTPTIIKTDSLNLTDTVSKDATITGTEQVSLADAITHTPTRQLSDSLTLMDSKTLGAGKTQTNIITLSDLIEKVINIIRTENITLTDFISKTKELPLTDSLSLTDSLMKQPDTIKSEAITLTDSMAKVIEMTRTELLNLTDVLINTAELLKAEAVTLTDSVISESERQKIIEDVLNLADSISKDIGHVLSDNITLTDDVIRGMMTTIDELLTLTDAFASEIGAGFFLEETVTLADTVNKSIAVEKSETITLSDAKQLQAQISKLEALTILVEIIKTAGLERSEAITLTDTIVREMAKILEETIALTDNLVKTISGGLELELMETVTLTDNVAANIKTILIMLKVLVEQLEGLKAKLER